MKITDLKCEHMNVSVDAPYLISSEKPHFSFCIEGRDNSLYVKYYKLIVSSELELLEESVGDMWDSGIVYSSDINDIAYNGKELETKHKYYFRAYAMVGKTALKSRIGSFVTGISASDGMQNSFISAPDGCLTTIAEAKDTAGEGCPYFRYTFTVDRPVDHSYMYVSALGIYKAYVNGKPAGDDLLSPGWTDYNKTLQYVFYDITDMLSPGKNTVGAVVGDGWFRSNLSFVGRNNYGDKNALSCYIYTVYKDGSYDEIYTGQAWECASGEILYTDNQNGEYCDKRLEKADYFTNDAKYGDTFMSVYYRPSFLSGTKLVPFKGPFVRKTESVGAVSVKKLPNGDHLIDMGQNLVGRLRIRLDEKEGSVITVRHGEMCNDSDKGVRGCDGDKGTLYTENLRTAKQTDTYICRGYDDIYSPVFTWHGFRYAQISGMTNTPATEDITADVIHTDCDRTGNITTFDDMLNKLISNISWGNRGNFVSLPTDCPQRDERLGWTGDAQVFCKSACYGMDCEEFYNKYLRDITDTQKPNGSVTDICPMLCYGKDDLVGNGNAAWGDAIFIIPYTSYMMYGDKRVLEYIFPYAKRYYEMLSSTAVGRLRPDFGYGDWLSVNADTPKDVMSTAFYAYDAALMSRICAVIGKPDMAKYYSDEFEKTAEAWREAYLQSGCRIKGDTQTCYLLALKFGLLKDPEDIVKARRHLLRKLEEAGNTLTTGFVGVSYLLPALSDMGRDDLAYDLLLTDKYPSWLYSVKNGATTIWERWNSYTEEDGFGDVGMNSFNHYSLGSCSEWMYEYMLGIKPLLPGYSKFSYDPRPDGRLSFVSGSYKSRSGLICSEWKRAGTGFEMRLTVPVNTTAVVPVKEGLYIYGQRGYTPVGEKLELGSGVYMFRIFS